MHFFINDSEHFNMTCIASKKSRILICLIVDPLDCGDPFSDLIRRKHVKALAMSLEFSQVLKLVHLRLRVFLQVEADDAPSPIPD